MSALKAGRHEDIAGSMAAGALANTASGRAAGGTVASWKACRLAAASAS